MSKQKEQDVLRYPKGEIGWVSYYDRSGQMIFLLTSKENSRDWYYLYEVINGTELKKLGKARTPPELEEKYHVVAKMSEGK